MYSHSLIFQKKKKTFVENFEKKILVLQTAKVYTHIYICIYVPYMH